MTNYSEWLETNDNQMALCPVNIGRKVRLSNSCPVYIFFWVLLHLDEHFHGAKLINHDDWRTLAAFFQCLVHCHQLLFIANSCDRFTRFQQLVVYHTFLNPPNTPFEHEYCVLALMDLVHLVVPLFFGSSSFQRDSIHHSADPTQAVLHGTCLIRFF